MPYVKAKPAADFYKLSPRRLRQLAASGLIKHITTPGGHYLYFIDSERDSEDESEPASETESDAAQPVSGDVLYARVSSRRQHRDLERQAKVLSDHFPGRRVVSDVGSGVNFQRRGFKAILEQLFAGHIRSVVVAHQDRWSRISFDFFQWLFERFGAKLEVLHTAAVDSNHELADDLVEIITSFTARDYGRRRRAKDAQDTLLPEPDAEGLPAQVL
jgi:predicted site-specific integrase-resolvase